MEIRFLDKLHASKFINLRDSEIFFSRVRCRILVEFLFLCFLEGKVAANQKQATHIVVSTSLDAKVEGCDAKQHLVSGEVCL